MEWVGTTIVIALGNAQIVLNTPKNFYNRGIQTITYFNVRLGGGA